MSLSSDNFTALIHLRDQARKWKNITFISIIVLLVILSKALSFSKEDQSNLSGKEDYIASVDVNGIIFSDKHRSKILKEIAKKDNIKAVIVNINSPGGGIVGSEMLYREIIEISKRKPVVATLGALAASGGYMVALGSQHIIAHNGTLTGSIGVIMQSSEVTQMAENIGIKFQNYKSSHLKGTPSLFEKTDPVIDKVINESVSDSYQFFVDLVLNSRKSKIDKNNVKKVTDGRIFTGRQALKVGLIDEIGGEIEALAYLKEHHKIIDLEIKDISLQKTSNKLIDKIFDKDSITKLLNGNFSNKKLMAIW